jgi:hypothetical protein
MGDPALCLISDTYVAAGRALQSAAATALAFLAIIVLLGLWYAYPLGGACGDASPHENFWTSPALNGNGPALQLIEILVRLCFGHANP